MSVVLSHPTGSPFVRAVLRTLVRDRRLESFWTAIAMPPGLGNSRILSEGLRRELGRRAFPEVPWTQTRVRPMRETIRLGAQRLGLTGMVRHEGGWASVDQVYRALDRNVAGYLRRHPSSMTAVYAYEDGAYHTFSAAKSLGIKRIYDLPIAHWRMLRRLLQEEASLHPGWAPTMEGLDDSADKLARKDEEIRLADQLVVASSFTRRSVEEAFGANLQIAVVPYGAPPTLADRPSRRAPGEPLHVFYAGHLSQRKGLVYLIAAMEKLTIPWRITLAGPRPDNSPAELDHFMADERCVWLGHVPHRTLLEKMCAAHVFVFPSIVEGFGMVLYEAMAAGLPVITTPNTAGPDIMTDGREGYIVPIRDPDAIASKLTTLFEDGPLREQMALAALACAARSGWDGYEAGVSALLDRLAA